MDAATGELVEGILKDTSYDFDGWIIRDPGTRKKQ